MTAKDRYAQAMAKVRQWCQPHSHGTPEDLLDRFDQAQRALSAPPDTKDLSVQSFVTDEVFICPRPIPQDLLRHGVILADRYELLRRLPKYGIVAEVGTDRGDFAKKIIEEARPTHLHLFDGTFQRFDFNYFSSHITFGTVTLHKGDSSTKMAELPDILFDWIYIDADHSFDGIKKDIEQALNKIKKTGIIVFNDYMLYSPL